MDLGEFALFQSDGSRQLKRCLWPAGAVLPETRDASVVGGSRASGRLKAKNCAVAVPLWWHGPEGWPQPGESLAWLDPPKTPETGSAFHYRRAKNEAKIYFQVTLKKSWRVLQNEKTSLSFPPQIFGAGPACQHPAWRERTWLLPPAKPLRCQDRDKAM